MTKKVTKRLGRSSSAELGPDSLLLSRDAVAAIVARCDLRKTAELHDRVRKYLAYVISERKIKIFKGKKVRLGDVARAFASNRKASNYRADLRDIMDLGANIDGIEAVLESLTGVGLSFPAERHAVVKIAISLTERVAVLQQQLEICHVAATRRLSIAQQKTLKNSLRLTLNVGFPQFSGHIN